MGKTEITILFYKSIHLQKDLTRFDICTCVLHLSVWTVPSVFSLGNGKGRVKNFADDYDQCNCWTLILSLYATCLFCALCFSFTSYPHQLSHSYYVNVDVLSFKERSVDRCSHSPVSDGCEPRSAHSENTCFTAGHHPTDADGAGHPVEGEDVFWAARD